VSVGVAKSCQARQRSQLQREGQEKRGSPGRASAGSSGGRDANTGSSGQES
jgi:hypothetical protein